MYLFGADHFSKIRRLSLFTLCPLTRITILAISSVLAIGCVALADDRTIGPSFHDDFAGTTIDSAWSLQYAGAASLQYDIANSVMEATSINGVAPFSWGSATFTRSVSAPADFDLSSDIRWSTEAGNSDIQLVIIEAVGENDSEIASIGYQDSWQFGSGSINGVIVGDTSGRNVYNSGQSSVAGEGVAALRISRTGTDLTIRWNNSIIMNTQSSKKVVAVSIRFAYYNYPPAPSVFGTLAVDRVTFAGPTCQGDLNGSGSIDFNDITQLLARFGAVCN